MNEKDKTSHLMLFCALLLAQKPGTSIKDLEQLYPFHGDVESVLHELAELES